MVESIGGNAAARLFGFVQRIERLDEEAANLGDDRKEVYKEVRSEGFDAKTLKLVVKRRRMDPAERQEEDAILELYERVVGEAESASRTPATDQGGVAQGQEQRPVEPKVEGSIPSVTATDEPPHDPETGEIIEDDWPKDDRGEEFAPEPLENVAAPEGPPADEDDDLLDIPPFLDRREEATT